MAELVGLVSAITALIGTGYKIAKTISDCVDDWGGAADQMMMIATDTKAMTWIFHDMKVRLKNSKKVTAQVLSLAKEIVELGQKTLRNVKECILPLMPRIDSLKLTVTLFLHAIDRASGDADEAETKEKIEELLVSARGTKMNFIKADILDQAVEHHYEPNHKGNDFIATSIDDDDDDNNNNNNNNEERPESPESSDSATGNSESYEIALAQNGFDYSKVDLSQWVQKHESPTRMPLEIMPVPSDNQFVEIADHLKVQMAVTSYALVVISDPNPRSRAGPTLTRSIHEKFSKASSKGIPKDQSIAQSEDSWSDGGMEYITNASETMEDRFGSSWKYTLPNRQHVPRSQPDPRGNENNPADPFAYNARQSGTFPGGAYHERPPTTPQYGQKQNPHTNAQTHPQFQGFPWDYPQQTAYDPYPYDNHWGWSKPPPPDSVTSRELPKDDPEKLEMKKQLEAIKAEKARREAEELKREFEMRIREETERAFKYKMEERDRQEELLSKERATAAERAKQEIEKARQAAEKATRELIEKERQMAEERRKEEAEAMARARQAARDQIEAERRAEESRKKWEADTLARAEQAAQIKLRAEMEAEAAKKDTKGGSLSFFKRLGR